MPQNHSKFLPFFIAINGRFWEELVNMDRPIEYAHWFRYSIWTLESLKNWSYATEWKNKHTPMREISLKNQKTNTHVLYATWNENHFHERLSMNDRILVSGYRRSLRLRSRHRQTHFLVENTFYEYGSWFLGFW